MNEFNLSSTILDEIQNHDDFQVVWLSTDDNIPNELTYFVDYLEKYHSIDTCKTYIEAFKSERKILLVLINLFEWITDFGQFLQIQSIYVLENTPQNIIYNKENYSKVVDIFTDEHTLIDRLRHDILLTYRNDLSISISYLDEIKFEQSFLSANQDTYLFLWYQLILYYLVDATNLDMDRLKKDMIEQCQLEYQDNHRQLEYIRKFDQTCTEDNVLKWYTEDVFVFRLVNKALRKRNIDLIGKFRYFIILLYKKLKQLSIQQQGKNLTTVYRGQILGKNDLKNLQSNVGGLILVNTMMSTTRNESVARQFIAGAETGILFEINTASTSYNILYPFADISQFSTKFGEEEILFFAGALFRIDSVEKEDNSTWIIKLTLSNKIAEQMEQLMDGVKEQLTSIINWDHLFMKVNDLILYGKYYRMLTKKRFSWEDIITHSIGIDIYHLMTVLGDYKKAIEYYTELLSERNSIDNSKFIVLNIIIGNNYFNLKEYDDALIQYNIARSVLNDNNQLVGELQQHIGDVHRETNDFESALLCYQDALKIFIDHHVDNRDIAGIYRKVSDIHLQQNNNEVALIYQEQADQIDQQHRQRSELNIETSLAYFQNQLNISSNHSGRQRADILYSIGLCLLKTSNYSQALDNFVEAETLFKTHLPTSDSFVHTFSTLYDSMALTYLMMKDNFNALIILKRSIDIRIGFYSK